MHELRLEQKKEQDFKVINLEDMKHGIRVAEYSVLVGRRLGVTAQELENVYLAAVLHDIGKAHLQQHILNKPGQLTEEELDHIKRHVWFGAEEAERMGCSQSVMENVLYHHENIDGSGYPHQLKGSSISLGARIIHICDAFDALRSQRPYKEGLSVRQALEVMRQEKRYYDSYIYQVFHKTLKDSFM